MKHANMKYTKLFKALCIILTLGLLATTLIGCGSDESLDDHPLLGTWSWDSNPAWMYDLRPDGTGTRGVGMLTENFTWAVRNSELRIDAPSSSATERWAFGFSDNALNLSRSATGESFNYYPIGGYANLVGTWHWSDDSTFTYVFNLDGTGNRGFGASRENLTWIVQSNGSLMFSLGGLVEPWRFQISDGVLTIDSQVVSGLGFRYVRQ